MSPGEKRKQNDEGDREIVPPGERRKNGRS